jgi:precorrin-6B methylase 1
LVFYLFFKKERQLSAIIVAIKKEILILQKRINQLEKENKDLKNSLTNGVKVILEEELGYNDELGSILTKSYEVNLKFKNKGEE